MRSESSNSNPFGPIRLGYVPLLDCAPLAVARETGIFERYGLDVRLQSALGWATIRDRLFYGELDAAQSISGIAFALGFGLTDLRCEVCVPLILNLHSSAITLSTRLPYDMIGNGTGLKSYLARHWKNDRPFTLAASHRFSSHGVLLHQWIKRHGLSDADVEVIILPPPLMPRHLEEGHIDGFCVAEPYNSEAILGGYGWCPAISSDLSFGHPEKVLLVAGDFIQKRKADSITLVAALLEACKRCDESEFRNDLIDILAMPEYTGASREVLENSLGPSFNTGVTKVPTEGFHMFHGDRVNRPSTDKASWMLAGLRAAESLPESSCGPLSRLYREDIYMSAINSRAV